MKMKRATLPYALTEADRELLAEHEDQTVIASSPWMTENGLMVYRIVLRDMKGQYVVHSQAFGLPGDFAKPYYYGGDYHLKNFADAFKSAWLSFEKRCHRAMGF